MAPGAHHGRGQPGQFRNQPHRLGRWRWPALALLLAVTVVVLVVPVAFALLGTFMKLFGFFHIADPWTLANWTTVLTDELFLRSLRNTLVLAVGTAVAAVLVHSLIAYIVVRTRYAGSTKDRDWPILNLTWDYGEDEPDPDNP